MNKFIVLGAILLTFCVLSAHPAQVSADVEDNDFAEFEDTDDDDLSSSSRPGSAGMGSSGSSRGVTPPTQKVVMSPEAAAAARQSEQSTTAAPAATAAAGGRDDDDDDSTVEADDEDDDIEDDEFEHLTDEDEFEGYDKERSGKSRPSREQPPDLKIAKVPVHVHTAWDSFYMEMLMLAGLGAYVLNFLAGKAKNTKLAHAWLSAHRQLLEENFAVIGDDGTGTEVQSGVLMKEAENIYCLWCSGRTCCEGMLVTIKLLKRQDLVSTLARLFKPLNDQIIIRVIMDDSEMDSLVFCLANKRSAAKMLKDFPDISNFCPEKKSAERFDLPSNFQLMSESAEASSYILDTKMVTAINKFEPMVEYIHFSDQFVGQRQPDDGDKTKALDTQKVLIFCFNVADKGNATPKDMEQMKPLLQMVFHCIDKMKRFTLSKEGKSKAEKMRVKIAESLQKATHAQRTEAAQARREEKRRAEKERMMNEEDPEKQRKLEEKNLKKDAKKKGPKMKRMKIKTM